MDKINLINPEKINLKDHPILNEQWLQDVIAKNPEILGLGDLVLKDKERKQPRAGRLDTLPSCFRTGPPLMLHKPAFKSL